jgi:hypothetical protein
MIELHINFRCDRPGTTMNITSNHLEIQQMPDNLGSGNTGEELAKRVPEFGLPVSRSMNILCSSRHRSDLPGHRQGVQWPANPPRFLEKRPRTKSKMLRQKGSLCNDAPRISNLMQTSGHRKGSRKMVTVHGCWLRIRPTQQTKTYIVLV